MAKHYNEDPEYSKCSKAEFELREKIVAIIAKHTSTFYGGYSYSSQEGVKEDDYEDVAEEIIAAFGMVK